MKNIALILALCGLYGSINAGNCPSGMHSTIHGHNKDNNLHGQQKLCKKCGMPKLQCPCGK